MESTATVRCKSGASLRGCTAGSTHPASHHIWAAVEPQNCCRQAPCAPKSPGGEETKQKSRVAAVASPKERATWRPPLLHTPSGTLPTAAGPCAATVTLPDAGADMSSSPFKAELGDLKLALGPRKKASGKASIIPEGRTPGPQEAQY